ncbi:hypothetical protein IQ06DRAFT_101613 [Phaeosphaeriaceae sp. SRC1lsM3a]|nr:hypothetical protein IQ06DRAFT_101613 [Stagonospora sp. SRC1lsM3a]
MHPIQIPPLDAMSRYLFPPPVAFFSARADQGIKNGTQTSASAASLLRDHSPHPAYLNPGISTNPPHIHGGPPNLYPNVNPPNLIPDSSLALLYHLHLQPRAVPLPLPPLPILLLRFLTLRTGFFASISFLPLPFLFLSSTSPNIANAFAALLIASAAPLSLFAPVCTF